MDRSKRRFRRSFLHVIILLGLLIGSFSLYVHLRRGELLENAEFQVNQQVSFDQDGKQQIGVISKITPKIWGEGTVVYDIRLSSDSTKKTVAETLLDKHTSKYKIGEVVELQDGTESSYQVDAISESDDGKLIYGLLAEDSTKKTVSQEEIVFIYQVPLKESHSAETNNQLIQEAMEVSKEHSMTVLSFPRGEFKIGSDDPDNDFLTLASNVELRSNATTLIVEGSARWYGFATGTGIRDGVTNFFMNDFQITASDLQAGNQFIIMLNHGYNIHAEGNTFTMVHQMGSHIFDLGGVELASFKNNKFVGYAPELTGESVVGDYSLHDIYAEAIQTDYSDGNMSWDGGFMAAIDENYFINNPYKWESKDIEITNNSLVPYRDESGKIIAYSATLGQHSSEVENLNISYNRIEKPLVFNFPEVDTSKYWYFTPVHAKSDGAIVLEPNDIIE